uniref:Protein YIPF n=1 Tax=Aceria tosichella TaxID=561515 RepID=A0A6G1S921_9ACAR
MSEDTLRQFMLASNMQRQQNQQGTATTNTNWILAQLSQYFDVTTADVIERILWSAIPIRKTQTNIHNDDELMAPLTDATEPPHEGEDSEPYVSNKQKSYSYMERFIQSRPDFYGPFWISSTLVFVVAIMSNIVSLIKESLKSEKLAQASALSHNESNGSAEVYSSQVSAELDGWHYSMDELNMTSSLVMTYLALVPTFFWFLFWFRGCSKYYTLTETVCAYGYSLSIFIPLALLLTIQAILVRYLMITLAAALSGGVLMLSFLPVVRSDPNPASSHIILAFVPLCQFGLAYVIHRIMLQ